MTSFYYVLSTLAGLLLLPGLIVLSSITGRKRRGLWHHFGFLPANSRPHRPTLWAHAISVGEVRAAAPLLAALREQRPDMRLAVTVTTSAGYETAQKNLGFVDILAYHPLDAWPFVSLAVQRIRPDLFVLIDTGFWPGLLFKLREKNVPAILLNGRISENSFNNYRKLGGFIREVFSCFSRVYMQNPIGVARAYDLGAREEAIALQADTKYDQLNPLPENERRTLREKLKLPAPASVLVAGSTHEGEETILLDAFETLREAHPALVMILAPRRLERLPEVEALLRSRNETFGRRTRLREAVPVILLDTMGELDRLYAVADAAFVGRSLISPGGGHSLAEAAIQGVPVLHGPYIENVKAQAEVLKEAGASIEIKSAADIVREVSTLLEDGQRRGLLGEQARILVEGQKGASREIAKIILQDMDGRCGTRTPDTP
ncbi:MAG: hypothetical protein KC553_13180 [Nitrospina sp.]|nr:hypothetical protein [Nitrospina sp.]